MVTHKNFHKALAFRPGIEVYQHGKLNLSANKPLYFVKIFVVWHNICIFAARKKELFN